MFTGLMVAFVLLAFIGAGLGMAAPAAIDPAKDELVRDGFASVEEAQDFLSLGRSSIYKLMDNGELNYARFGRTRRIPWRSLREYATRQLTR